MTVSELDLKKNQYRIYEVLETYISVKQNKCQSSKILR
jgi:hypothetical protein